MRWFEIGAEGELGGAGVRALRPWCAAFEDADDEGMTIIAITASCADALDALRTAGWREAPAREREALERLMQTLALGADEEAARTDGSRRAIDDAEDRDRNERK
jgi:hypothetical protein